MTGFTTTHRILATDARDLRGIASDSVHLVVTSPPYPMVAMWDEVFCALSPAIREARRTEAWGHAFELMHVELDRVWAECHRVVRTGGFACINIGDATRTLGEEFRLFSNHARILLAMERAGFTTLPDILWRKPTNAPNKFMGSGMLPAGAYVTYEHEYILIFRKGGRRAFATPEEKSARRRSAFFWEERNVWFSDVWTDLTGARQGIEDDAARARSASFPFELPYRLIQMLSLQGDVVLDPFAGLGTTLAAALGSARNSVGVELDVTLIPAIERSLLRAPVAGNTRVEARLEAHHEFVESRTRDGKAPGHRNERYGFPVVTGQEEELALFVTHDARVVEPGRVEATHDVAGRNPMLGR